MGARRLLLVLVALCGPLGVARGASPEWADLEPLAPKSLLIDAATAGDVALVVGERGHILRSRDGGTTWEQLRVPTRATLTAVTMLDARRACAVGHDAVVLLTEDGGDTWQLAFQAPDEQRPLLDVWFADDESAIAVGAYSLFLTSSDGGHGWAMGELEIAPVIAPDVDGGVAIDDATTASGADDELIEDYHLHHLSRAATGRTYLAAEAGNIYGSDDAGVTWRHLSSPYEGSFFGVLPLDDHSLLAYGLRGHLFRSDDAGATWTAIDTGSHALLDGAARLADGTVVVVGLEGTVLVSRDGGRSFTLYPQDDRLGIAAITELAAGKLLLVGEGGVRVLPLAALTAEGSR